MSLNTLLYGFFPKMCILDSNHGSMVYRRLKDAGIPLEVVKKYNDVLQAPVGWKWYDDLLVTASNGQDIYFHHGKSNNVQKESQLHSMNFVSGHWHSTFEIRYWANKNALYWGMSCGCLVDQSSLANEEKLLMGYCSKSPIEIHINKSLSKEDAEHTYCHEICHAIMFRVGLDQVLSHEAQEIICETFGSFMFENMKFK